MIYVPDVALEPIECVRDCLRLPNGFQAHQKSLLRSENQKIQFPGSIILVLFPYHFTLS